VPRQLLLVEGAALGQHRLQRRRQAPQQLGRVHLDALLVVHVPVGLIDDLYLHQLLYHVLYGQDAHLKGWGSRGGGPSS
jgi:hypothetical protein